MLEIGDIVYAVLIYTLELRILEVSDIFESLKEDTVAYIFIDRISGSPWVYYFKKNAFTKDSMIWIGNKLLTKNEQLAVNKFRELCSIED